MNNEELIKKKFSV